MKLGPLLKLVLGLWCCWLGLAVPALASIHTYPEGSGQVMHRSLQTVRDQSDRAWQLVLFKRSSIGQANIVHLRLVGFPGSIELNHPHPLRISGSERGWRAPDSLPAGSSFPANVGEYDVLEPLTQLTSNAPLQLWLPIKVENVETDVELILPPFVVKEWRQVMAMD